MIQGCLGKPLTPGLDYCPHYCNLPQSAKFIAPSFFLPSFHVLKVSIFSCPCFFLEAVIMTLSDLKGCANCLVQSIYKWNGSGKLINIKILPTRVWDKNKAYYIKLLLSQGAITWRTKGSITSSEKPASSVKMGWVLRLFMYPQNQMLSALTSLVHSDVWFYPVYLQVFQVIHSLLLLLPLM